LQGLRDSIEKINSEGMRLNVTEGAELYMRFFLYALLRSSSLGNSSFGKGNFINNPSHDDSLIACAGILHLVISEMTII